MNFDFNQERNLEHKHQGVLTYVDAKHFLEKTPYTAAKINGAIKRFCNSEEGLPKPATFIEMESFVADLADFWLDTNPEVHCDGESVLHGALSNYVAFSIVWKTKSKASSIIDPVLMGMAGKMLIFRNSLGNAVKIVNSRLAHDTCPNKELYRDFRDALPDAFFKILPFAQKLLTGDLEFPNGQTENDLNRLIGGFFAKDPLVLAASDKLKMLEHKEQIKAA